MMITRGGELAKSKKRTFDMTSRRKRRRTDSALAKLSLTGFVLASIAAGKTNGWSPPCPITKTKRAPILTPTSPLPRSSGLCSFIKKPRNDLRVELAKNGDAFWEVDSQDGTEEDFPYASSAGGSDLEIDELQLKWESCSTDAGTAHVLLPPPTQRLPTCIIHFVGGTFFGSTPHVWYHQLLEDLVRHSSAAVVATSIPVTVLQSPLQHVELAKKLWQQFQAAYRQVLVDEYGSDERGLQQVPVCGLGHSLGARLLVVASTLPPPTSKSRSGNRQMTHSYKSLILMSFTNFGASAGIPGVGSLYRASRHVEQTRDQETSQSMQRSGRRERSMDYDCDDMEDDGDLWQDLTDVVRESARWIQSSLTPDSSQLEFFPTPAQLWAAVTPTESGGGGRYRTPQTLLVQFDRDRVDQSSKLAGAVRDCSDVRFCRLRGNHLSPVSPNPQSKVVRWSRRMMDDPQTVVDLRRSIVRYLTEVVTKD